MPRLWLLLGLLVGSSLVSCAWAAELRIGFVNIERILADAPQAQAATARLEREFAPKDKELAEQKQRFRDIEDELVRNRLSMSFDEVSRAESELRELGRKIKLLQDEIDQELRVRRSQELSKFQRQIREVIGRLAKEKDFDLVLTAGVFYASERADITGLVLSTLKDEFSKASQSN
ncbi:MAG: OmpH family outer membrane protein [Gammaproteobacteria bacterium]|nr:OmpH family outer membrane protein [Gammaproteobacteria bacterium]